MSTFKTISENTQYWFIRAGRDSGKFFYNFKENGVVALGHAEDVVLPIFHDNALSDEEKEMVLISTQTALQNREESKSQISNKVNQIRRFIEIMKPGDIVITINDTSIMTGQVTSGVYFGSVGLTSNTERDKGSNDTCYFNLRCNVNWGRIKNRSLLPSDIEKIFRYTGSILQLDKPEQIKSINHWLYPIHFVEDEVRCTLKISSKEELSNRQLTKLSGVLDELELLADYLSNEIDNNGAISHDKYLTYATEYRDSYTYTLKAQHQFMSPGHQFLQLDGSETKKVIFAILLQLTLSSEVTGASLDDVVPEGVDLQMIESIVQSVNGSNDVAVIKASLDVGLSKPSVPVEEISEAEHNIDDGWGSEPSENSAL
ncbi:hypothetical protein MHO82_20975 [Vibrio sp. Of7-15]|uniref:hypothetical protein n=1 Tax=Vibrio sp. Of7-15 TaxID=2724879 RepID=UPI001EF1BE22|nr:hypothetical protein [Vibrio sp. Of7-15]MCG7499342.1 hypothetical protein [Vibrio sp. Of7-15]